MLDEGDECCMRETIGGYEWDECWMRETSVG